MMVPPESHNNCTGIVHKCHYSPTLAGCDDCKLAIFSRLDMPHPQIKLKFTPGGAPSSYKCRGTTVHVHVCMYTHKNTPPHIYTHPSHHPIITPTPHSHPWPIGIHACIYMYMYMCTCSLCMYMYMYTM